MTTLCFIDTETTSLRPDRRAWDIGIIARRDDGTEVEHQWFIDAADLELGNADPFALKIGRFHERHPQYRLDREPAIAETETEYGALRMVEAITRGAHLVGAVVSFDADVLGQRMRANGILPAWHYHLIDTEGLAVGFLNGRRARQNEIVDGFPAENNGEEAPGLVRWNDPGPWTVSLPWKSDDLTAALSLPATPDDERHTALGDARWAMRIYDRVMGTTP